LTCWLDLDNHDPRLDNHHEQELKRRQQGSLVRRGCTACRRKPLWLALQSAMPPGRWRGSLCRHGFRGFERATEMPMVWRQRCLQKTGTKSVRMNAKETPINERRNPCPSQK
jgi:hypothetical protein